MKFLLGYKNAKISEKIPKVTLPQNINDKVPDRPITLFIAIEEK